MKIYHNSYLSYTKYSTILHFKYFQHPLKILSLPSHPNHSIIKFTHPNIQLKSPLNRMIPRFHSYSHSWHTISSIKDNPTKSKLYLNLSILIKTSKLYKINLRYSGKSSLFVRIGNRTMNQ